MLAQSDVFTKPGTTRLTRVGASSAASARGGSSIAMQILAPSAQPERRRRPALPELNMIELPGRMLGVPYLAAKNAPNTLW